MHDYKNLCETKTNLRVNWDVFPKKEPDGDQAANHRATAYLQNLSVVIPSGSAGRSACRTQSCVQQKQKWVESEWHEDAWCYSTTDQKNPKVTF